MPTIFHYTSQSGFEGIVKEDGIHLWFSDARFLNDANEIIGSKKCLDIAANQLYENHEIDEEILKKVLEVNYNPRKFDGIKPAVYNGNTISFQITSANYDTYVCCFSKDSDSLPMWNYYLKNDGNGYAVGLDFEGLDLSACSIRGEVVDEKCFEIHTETIPVLYDDSEKIDIFKSEILDYSKDYKSRDERDRPSATVAFQQSFEQYSIAFKDSHFAYENETRIVATVKDSEEQFINGKRRDDIRFRLSKGLAIPYFELLITDKNILKAVSISPKIGLNTDNENAVKSMKRYLKNMGYDYCVDIQCSEIPLRYY